MVTIREMVENDESYVKYIANLHIIAFPDFFLTQLGQLFLETLYIGYIEDSESGIIVAEDKGLLLGFVAYSKDYPRFYKSLLRNHLGKFALCSFRAAIRHPSFIKKLLFAFKKSNSVVKEEKYIELSSICVNPQIKSHGVGTKLVKYLIAHSDFKQYTYINLETDAEGNDAANCFYQKNGFRLFRQYTTDEGRRMNEYRYVLGE